MKYALKNQKKMKSLPLKAEDYNKDYYSEEIILAHLDKLCLYRGLLLLRGYASDTGEYPTLRGSGKTKKTSGSGVYYGEGPDTAREHGCFSSKRQL